MPKAELAGEWITKEAAAKLLGVNVRQVEKRIQAGSIEKRRLPKLPTESVGRVEVARGDVDALLAGTPNSHAVEVSNDADKFPAPTGDGTADLVRIRKHLGIDDPLAMLRHIARTTLDLSPAPAPPAPRAWLTLDEAAEHSGLTEETIMAQVSAGNIDAVDRHGRDASVTGPQRRHLRIKRASLDAFGELERAE